MTDQERAEKLLAVLGSFWSQIYADRSTVAQLCQTLAYASDELARKLDEARKCVVVDTMPAFHKPRWYPLVRVTGGSAVREYGDGMLYATSGNSYGRSDPRITYIAPLAMAACPILFETALGSGRVFLLGQDYTLSRTGTVLFEVDPGLERLYAYEPSIDLSYVWEAFGFLTLVKEDSSERYANFVRAFVTEGAGNTFAGLRRLVCAAFDVPCATEEQTVEEVITLSDDRTYIVTDIGGYPVESIAVSVGDVLKPGDSIDGSITFQTFRGPIDTAPAFLQLDSGMVLTGPLMFGPGFERSGGAQELQRFEDDVTARQTQYETTVNQAVGGIALPETDLLVRESLRYSVTIVTVNRPTATGSIRLTACRPLMPVHAVLLFNLILATVTEDSGIESQETISSLGYAMTNVVDSAPLRRYAQSELTSTC